MCGWHLLPTVHRNRRKTSKKNQESKPNCITAMTRTDIYEQSNSMATVAIARPSKKEYAKLLNDGNRQRDAQALCDYLCSKLNIAPCRVVVTSRCQPHSINSRGAIRSKKYGNYRPGVRLITIYDTTAIRKQQVSIKTFADTLLHEFVHHYDIECLHLATSLHTAGFYKRISDLKEKLS